MKQKEFAKEQREKAAHKATKKKLQHKEQESSTTVNNPHAFKNTHAVKPGQRQSSASPERLLAQKKLNSTIHEQAQEFEESEISALNSTSADQITKREIEEKTAIINKYKRIDQVTLQRVGLKHK